ncbi:uncharacterized protein LTR77_001212 [Saxophila tyrrhenica]|uniref:Uncharacterized protein n=1 Tax=Saxophila tyrrhenica TaxID=1690608 RepID=A0AAV9PPB9_9PEZI|nr:hypothetical protein LTR77_001212 [Saxophila tyrrhenica]
MFAPPPVQLSRAQIEARLAARRQSAVASGPLSPTASLGSATEDRAGSLHAATTAPTSPLPRRPSDNVSSSPILASPSSASRSRLEHPKSGASPLRPETAVQQRLPDGFGERPRRAPQPPRRSTAPPDEWFGPRAKTAPVLPPPPPPAQVVVPELPKTLPPPIPVKAAETVKEELPPPPIPAKSAKRSKARGADILRLLEEDPFNGGGSSLSKSNSKRKGKGKDVVGKGAEKSPSPSWRLSKEQLRQPAIALAKPPSPPVKVPEKRPSPPAGIVEERPVQPARAWTAPAATTERNIAMPAKESVVQAAITQPISMSPMDSSVKSTASSKASSKLSGVRGGRVDKASKRLSSDSSLRSALLDLDELYSFASPGTPPSKPTDGETNERSGSLSEIQLPWRRQRKGETMSMLLQSGFFPVGNEGKVNANMQLGVRLPPPPSILSKDLPATPSSIAGTPIELYQRSSQGALRSPPGALRSPPGALRSPPGAQRHSARAQRRPGNKRRSPLSHVATNSAKSSSSVLSAESEEMSPSRLSAIPEYAPSSENSPPPSGVTTPIATQIHLRGGSVVTVCPPEMNAWQRRIYVQGPIKLPKPVIVPRKNSVASLEPFQDAIDRVYQDALSIPRRRSDEQVVDDVCEFFDEYGFDEVGFEGDVIAGVDMLDEEMKDTSDSPDAEIERFSTPPAEPDASPLEKVVAKEVVEILSKPAPVPVPRAPRNDLESLRTRGIAYLAHRISHPPASQRHVRKDSLTLIPEEPTTVSSRAENEGSQSMPAVKESFRGDDVEELDGASSWLGLGIPGLHRSNSRTPGGQAQTLALGAMI